MKKSFILLLAVAFVLSMAAVAQATDPTNDTPFTFGENPANTPAEQNSNEYNESIPTGFVEPGPWENMPYLSGASIWAYRDDADSGTKYEGSYNAFGAPTGVQGPGASDNLYDYDASGRDKGPHGSYGTTTNKCKTCHAVHRANGAFALLRVDSADDACSYCHVGAHRHSVVSSYWQAGSSEIHPANGHTIGAGKKIPDSSVWQYEENVTLESMAQGEDSSSVTFSVRRYSPTRNKLMRWIAHGGRMIRVGPTYLRCSSCHQVHNATRQIWRPFKFKTDQRWAYGYKLLRNSPSGGIKVETGDVNGTMGLAPLKTSGLSSKAVSRTTFSYYEGTGTNDDQRLLVAGEMNSVDPATETDTPPVWTPEGVGGVNTTGYTPWVYHADGLTAAELAAGLSTDDKRIYETNMAFWCADCHNLNIAGKDKVATNWGTGRRGLTMLGDRSHAVPMNIRAGKPTSTGSQCYSCHNNDMPFVGASGTGGASATWIVPANYGQNNLGGVTITMTSTQDECGSCHITPAMYVLYKETYRTFNGVAGGNSVSDWPHAGPSSGYKLLNSITPLYKDNPDTNMVSASNFDAARIDPLTGTSEASALSVRLPFKPASDGLDKICLICHGSQGKRSIGYDK